MGEGAWVFFLEAGVAMGLLVFIVWWTMLSKPDIARLPPPVKDEAADAKTETSTESKPATTPENKS